MRHYPLRHRSRYRHRRAGARRRGARLRLAHGVDFRRRRALVREQILAMQRLWSDEVASFEGELVHLPPSWAWPKPMQRPRPPILIGGAPSPRLFEHIAEYADGWLPIGGAGVAAAVPDLHRAFERAARTPSARARRHQPRRRPSRCRCPRRCPRWRRCQRPRLRRCRPGQSRRRSPRCCRPLRSRPRQRLPRRLRARPPRMPGARQRARNSSRV
ncbi:LLM class flavin-dependent oxidoreductase [Sorangium sp. So ce887]|uniref:LLM class flavin-dependent oxidoreductase n=1 Tax=Sorangium sp. So ce887 TaxID=3133324 RepID=UPI003F5FD289